MRRAELAACAVVIGFVAALPAAAAQRIAVSVAAGPLGDAIATLGIQAGVSIGTMDPVLGNLRVPRLRGVMSVDQALTRLLRGVPARAQQIDATSWRIVRSALSTPAAPNRRPAPSRLRAAMPSTTTDIVVTASKRDTALRDYPGAAYLLDGEDL